MYVLFWFENIAFASDSWGTYQPIAVVNGNGSSRHVRDVANEGAVCFEELSIQYPVRANAGAVPAFRRVAVVLHERLYLIVPLNHGPRGHQPPVGVQPQVELLAEGGDVEEEFLALLQAQRGVPLYPLLVVGREQVRQIVPLRVGADGGD